MARMNVVFEDALLEEMRELVPSRRRSGFIEEAVRARLTLLRQIQAVEAAAGAWSDEDRGDPSEEIERLRHTWGDRQRRMESDSWQRRQIAPVKSCADSEARESPSRFLIR